MAELFSEAGELANCASSHGCGSVSCNCRAHAMKSSELAAESGSTRFRKFSYLYACTCGMYEVDKIARTMEKKI